MAMSRMRWRRWLSGTAEDTAGAKESDRDPHAALEQEDARRTVYAVLDQMSAAS